MLILLYFIAQVIFMLKLDFFCFYIDVHWIRAYFQHWDFQDQETVLRYKTVVFFLNFFKNTLHLFQTNFYAFKIPESNFLVFEATVTTCRGGCQPVSKQQTVVVTNRVPTIEFPGKLIKTFAKFLLKLIIFEFSKALRPQWVDRA